MHRTLQQILPQAQIDTVEIDPAVLKIATTYFGFQIKEKSTVTIGDGRVYVKRAQKQSRRYDLIILDAYGDTYIPEHMLSKEYLMEVKSILAPHGVLAANTFSSSRLYHAESATYGTVFGDFYNLKKANRIILTKNDGLPSISEITANADALETHLQPYKTKKTWLLPLFSTNTPWPSNTRILTDQYSPVNLLNNAQ